ncbi:hypothetical protein PIROE2DRAFT_6324 [Piromyces sp. E2]|nr:hypothetical protein PIROE2DRAFT_6324 [Piromyces sp. E2]|eukprot:OUM66485.1 hypothetical protein PIROE2DRAFT_6324 [Piromyces sp. E2]
MLTNEFNEYSNQNYLNITLKHILFTPENSTELLNNYGESVESLMKRKSDKYEIYMFDSIFTYRYKENLINLKINMPQEFLDNYDSDICALYE